MLPSITRQAIRQQRRRYLFASVSVVAILTAGQAHGRDILRGNTVIAPSSAAVAASQTAAQNGAAAARRAQEVLARTTQALQSMHAVQVAARNAALQAQSAIPNGLTNGGLKVAPGATSGSPLWQGADLPTEFTDGGRTQVEIKQNEQKAILTWETFNVGRETDLYFNQTKGGADASQWIALNRVLDPSAAPSKILGTIKAEGQVYIINQNGILFGGSSQINVHTLVASSLDFRGATIDERNANFQLGIAFDDNRQYTFGTDGGVAQVYPAGDGVTVQRGAKIETHDAGAVLLLGHNVVNEGEIVTPDGQTVLAAGARVWISKNRFGTQVDSTDPDLRGVRAAVQLGGAVINEGLISADRGNITLTGKSITQAGILAATTSATANGSITLLAGDGAANHSQYWVFPTEFGEVTFAPGSVVMISPDTNGEKAMGNQYRSSKIDVFSQTFLMQEDSLIYAPAGRVMVSAKTNSAAANAENDPSFIYLDRGAEIYLAGLQGVEVAMERNNVTGELRLDELKDAPLLRNSPLRGQKVMVDLRYGTTLADLTGYYGLIEYDVREKMTNGGSLQLDSGTIVTREGSLIDLSGGSLRYLDGYITNTHLIGANGRIYNITNADPNMVYTGIYGTYVAEQERWGIKETYVVPLLGGRRLEPGYLEGKDAGSLILGPKLASPSEVASLTEPGVRPYFLALDGTIAADLTVGPNQRAAFAGTSLQQIWQQLPRSASLTIGFMDQSTGRPLGPSITIGDAAPLPDDFTLSAGFDPASARDLVLPSRLFDGSTFGRLTIVSAVGGGDLVIPEGVTVNLGAFGSLNFTGSRALIDGAILAPGGSVSLQTIFAPGWTGSQNVNWNTLAPEQMPGIRLGGSAVIDVAGTWTNDRLSGAPLPLVLNGGSVRLQTVHDIVLAPGSLIDVSGGGQLTAAGRVVAGNGGSIFIQNDLRPLGTNGFGGGTPTTPQGALNLAGELRGYALGTGGSLTLGTSREVVITNPELVPAGGGTSAADILYLTPDFFRANGFASYSIGTARNLTVAAGTVVEPATLSYVANVGLYALASGGDIRSVADIAYLPADLRKPMSLTLSNALRQPGGSIFVNPLAQDFTNDLTIETGAQILMDPKSSVSLYATRNLYVDGTISTPGGAIALASTPIGTGGGSVRLGANARLLAPGYVKTTSGTVDVRSVENAGSVAIGGTGGIYTDLGSVIDVSGAAGFADLKQAVPQWGRPGNVAQWTGGNAGSVSFSGFVTGYIAGQIAAAPGADTAAGGSVSISVGALDPASSKEIALLLTDSLTVRATGAEAFPSVGATSSTPTAWTNTVAVYAPALRDSEADNLTFQSPKAIVFDGDFSLSTRRSLTFNAGLLGIANNAPADSGVELSAPHVSFGAFPGVGGFNAAPPPATTPLSVLGQLTVSANLIDIYQTLDLGGTGLRGFAEAHFVSTGDIRLTMGNGPTTFVGRLQSPGALILESAQTYVTAAAQIRSETDTGFLIQSGTSVTFLGNGNPAPVPYSFGETLTVRAPTIVQAGVLRAPQGRINLEATNSLILAEGSLTSVSLEGLVVPMGSATAGLILPYNTAGTVPPKAIKLGGLDVEVRDGAVVDLSGGGDLYAYEFIPGNGGSRDILNDAGMFAILPSFSGGLRRFTGDSLRPSRPAR